MNRVSLALATTIAAATLLAAVPTPALGGRAIRRIGRAANVTPTFEAAGLRPLKNLERALRDNDKVEAEVVDADKLGALGLTGLKNGDRITVEVLSADAKFRMIPGVGTAVEVQWDTKAMALQKVAPPAAK
jgi:hypothetical protein